MGLYRHIYLHVPFCEVICHYCDFYTARTKEADFEKFFAALAAEARSVRHQLADQIHAIYFGGGTPSSAKPDQIRLILDLFRDRIGTDTEITLEANPRDITKANAIAWRDAGINRVSIGIQSLNGRILRRLGRAHSAEEAVAAIKICVETIGNVTGDLIYGVPGQATDEPANHAVMMAELGVKHFSAYHLTIPKEHFLFSSLPEDGIAFEQIQMVAERLAVYGFRHYEISNFGKPGYESQNNLNYWHGGPYLALGPSAHGFDGENVRWQNVANWNEYVSRIEMGNSPVETREILGPEQRMIEAVFTGLRLEEGLDVARIEKAYQCDLLGKKASIFRAWESEGVGKLSGGVFVPTFRGRMLADELARKLL